MNSGWSVHQYVYMPILYVTKIVKLAHFTFYHNKNIAKMFKALFFDTKKITILLSHPEILEGYKTFKSYLLYGPEANIL